MNPALKNYYLFYNMHNFLFLFIELNSVEHWCDAQVSTHSPAHSTVLNFINMTSMNTIQHFVYLALTMSVGISIISDGTSLHTCTNFTATCHFLTEVIHPLPDACWTGENFLTSTGQELDLFVLSIRES